MCNVLELYETSIALEVAHTIISICKLKNNSKTASFLKSQTIEDYKPLQQTI